MSDVGGTGILTNVDYTFSDAATASMNATAGNATGTYKPTMPKMVLRSLIFKVNYFFIRINSALIGSSLRLLERW